MNRRNLILLAVGLLVVMPTAGCNSPYHADRGALFGGLLGAGTGALIGNKLGNAGAGAAIGAGLGALGGAAIGSELDNMEARNRANMAAIELRLGRRLAAGATSVDQVVEMSRAGVSETLIINHIRANGMTAPPGTSDLILLQNAGVSTEVVKAMQQPPPQAVRPATVHVAVPPPVIVEEHHYVTPSWGPSCRPRYYRHYYRRPGVSWGMSFGH